MYSFMRCNWAWLSALDFWDSEIFLMSHLSKMPSNIADVLETKSCETHSTCACLASKAATI